ncbi:OLC1v1008360C1 [Oldenlandia corymbosa var. corymbosa]|uniref:OLC1v1008360C1 n=1 Tax=Oldenlandia corymbosa var. corymbosa TaxID=529605 RepID=A0AAV1DPP4_OLDCO|nr:OLC1v1008360C1 [Oldenlandia corymbosa var. corymbosa]
MGPICRTSTSVGADQTPSTMPPNPLIGEDVRDIWGWDGPQKIRTFLWLLGKNRILTNGERRRHHLTIDASCQRCGALEETALHAVRDCPEAKQVCCKFVTPHLHSVFFGWDHRMWVTGNLQNSLHITGEWALLFGVVAWKLWRWRNLLIFENEVFLLPYKVGEVVKKMREVQDARRHRNRMGQQCISKEMCMLFWRLPVEGKLNLNSDRAVDGNTGWASAGGADQRPLWCMKGGFMMNIGYCSITGAELLGLYQGLKLAWDSGYRDLEANCFLDIGMGFLMDGFLIEGLLMSRKSLFCIFLVPSLLFVVSWFFVLRLSGSPHLVDINISSRPKLLSTTDADNSEFKGNGFSTDHSYTVKGIDSMKGIKCTTNREPLKVFMYDLPSEFHFKLLGWNANGNSVWPDIRSSGIPAYPGGLNLQHSIEYWLTLDLLSSEFAGDLSGRSSVRVKNSSEADVVFVPFFSSLSLNRYSRLKPQEKKTVNTLLQQKLVTYLTSQKEWKRSGGIDHVVVAHHPNSLLDARYQLWPAMFILSDFGRYPPTVANVDKDIIAPYKHVVRTFVTDASDFDSRPTLLFFQGAIYRKDGGTIRQELFYMLKDEKDVHFSFGSVQKDGIRSAAQGMQSSKFCLNIAGDTPSSNRLFDAIASHCVPIIISDEIELPYEDVLDYSEFCILIRTTDALKEKFVINLARNIGKDQWTRMWTRLKEVENFFEYRFPSRENDAVQMIWQAIARKVPAMKMKLNKARRYSRTDVPADQWLKTLPLPLPRNFW